MQEQHTPDGPAGCIRDSGTLRAGFEAKFSGQPGCGARRDGQKGVARNTSVKLGWGRITVWILFSTRTTV